MTNNEIKYRPILHLNLKKKWFDMIESGEKTEEYRNQSAYWCNIIKSNIKIKGQWYHPTEIVVCFSNGYSKDRRQMFRTLKSISSIGELRAKWGAIAGVEYFVLKLDKKN